VPVASAWTQLPPTLRFKIESTPPRNSMARRDTDEMIGIGGRWWSFPGAHIETNSWEVECHGDGKLYLHDDTGAVIEGIELDETEVEQLSREVLLADVLELAAAKLRSGEGWDEGTTTDVLNEIEHATGGGSRLWLRRSQ